MCSGMSKAASGCTASPAERYFDFQDITRVRLQSWQLGNIFEQTSCLSTRPQGRDCLFFIPSPYGIPAKSSAGMA